MAKELPENSVEMNSFARLNITQSAILFSAYDEKDNLIYEEIFSIENQQTLLNVSYNFLNPYGLKNK